MTEQQIDRERLRENAAEGGPWGAVVLALLDQLDQAEADVKRLSWSNGHLADKYAADMEELRQDLDQAEARIKAVRDLCDDADKRHASVLIVTTIRRALDG